MAPRSSRNVRMYVLRVAFISHLITAANMIQIEQPTSTSTLSIIITAVATIMHMIIIVMTCTTIMTNTTWA